MASLPVITDVFRVALTWHNASLPRPAANVMHFRSATLNAEGVWGVLDADVVTAMWDQTDANSAVVDVSVTPLDGTSVTFSATPAGTKWKGGIGPGTDCTPQVASIVKLLTATRGRSYRGRVFLPFVSEDANDSGFLASATQVAMQSAWSTFLATAAGDDLQLVVASYKHATAADVTVLQVESLLATQRDRQRR